MVQQNLYNFRTRELVATRFAFMRQAEVHHNLLHLRLHLLLRQTLQTRIKPDVFLHGEPGTHREEYNRDLERVSYYFGIHLTTKLLKRTC